MIYIKGLKFLSLSGIKIIGKVTNNFPKKTYICLLEIKKL